jgi:phenylpropionate dioxygenase-like ring-hydroxylating dioxygenase large terminal subunit
VTIATTGDSWDDADKRGSVFDLGPGAHQCWYPVALSSQVPAGKVIGRDFADGRIILYRGQDGGLRAMSAYCRHMGTDLSVGGEVIGNTIRCPYHHWAYGDGGRCVQIPSGDAIPKSANLFQFPLKEQFGLIWIFFGEEPLYELQTFPDFDAEKHVVRSYVSEHDTLHCEPWVFTTNIYDFVHLRFLHNMKIINSDIQEVDPYRSRMSWDVDLGEKAAGGWRPEIYVYGVNSIRTVGDQAGRLKWYIAASSPFGREGTRFFFTIVTTKGDGAEEFLDRQAAMHARIQNEDVPILNNLRYGNFNLVKSDQAMMRFMRKVLKYPRTSMQELEKKASSGKA